MGQIVAALALSHAPGLTGWVDQAPEEQQMNLRRGFSHLGEVLRATRPDVIIGLANDHVLNLPLSNTPDFCVGTADVWRGPAPWFKDWINVPEYTVNGHRELATALVREGARRGVRFAFSENLLFDDNWSVPLYYLTPEHNIRLVPIHMDCIVPPLPSPERCYEVGRIIAEIVETRRPANERVAIMGTGGLSHDPGGPKYFNVDEKFDRWFLDLLKIGDPGQVVREVTMDKMVQAGDGGTTELLSWIAAMGAVGRRRAEVVCYEPAEELRCGMGCVYWNMNEPG
ncbi:MAG: hypothetical protein ACREP6_05110 [Candidatus Binataceae bacterium]